MGTIRESTENNDKLDALSRTKDLKQALEIMVELRGSTYLEEECIIEYDPKTGKPSRYEWKPCEKFKNNFTFGGESFGGTMNIQLRDEIINQIVKKPVLFTKDDKKYMAEFRTIDHSGSDRDGYHHCVEHVICLKEINKI